MPDDERQLPSAIDPEKELPSPVDPANELPPGDDQSYHTVMTLLSWKAPSRPFRKKDRSFYTTVAVLLILTSIFVFLAGERILIGVILALGFVVYVLNFIPPEEVGYKISTQGVTIGDHFYHWQELDSFWFSEKDGYKLLNILTQLRFPGMLMLVFGPTEGSGPGQVNGESIKDACARFLPFHEIAPKSLIDKWAETLQKHIQLENPHR